MKLRKAAHLIAVIISVVLIFGLTSCGSGEKSKDDGKLNIVTTIYPEYDWAKELAGDKANVSYLINSGVDLHSFQPSAKDINEISQADIFIYTGGESEEWVEDVLDEIGNDGRIVINLIDVLGDKVREEEVVEGMQEEDHDESGKEDDDPDKAFAEEQDEHVWLSLRNAKVFAKELSSALIEADTANKEFYSKNADSYMEKLDELDKKYESGLKDAKVRTVLFGDRFPFRYMCDDYDIKYFAAFPGCSAETEASFETIRFLAGKVDELGLKAIMVTEGSDEKIAKAISKNTKEKDQKILALDSMQSKTMDDVEKGASYLSVMEKNLGVLKEALGV